MVCDVGVCVHSCAGVDISGKWACDSVSVFFSLGITVPTKRSVKSKEKQANTLFRFVVACAARYRRRLCGDRAAPHRATIAEYEPGVRAGFRAGTTEPMIGYPLGH